MPRFHVKSFLTVAILIAVTIVIIFTLDPPTDQSSTDGSRVHRRWKARIGRRGSTSVRDEGRADGSSAGVEDVAAAAYPADDRVTFAPYDFESLQKINNARDQIIKDTGYRQYSFNVLASNRLSYTRSIPDTRHLLCKSRTYPVELPAASIVICFYNEAWSVLLRLLYTIIHRTADRYIHEIILLDDFSEYDELKAPLVRYIKRFPKVKLIRTTKREGLIRARSIGAAHATGEVLVFLDSHCEVNVHWLEPMLQRIHENRTNVAIPVIDIINQDSFKYELAPLVRGGFNWGMNYKWDGIPSRLIPKEVNRSLPIETPTMAGGLFAIDRKYFFEMGEYDKGMETWGGENLEISFRIWMCGGRLEIIPCSRIGHVFRRNRPYGDPAGVKDSMTRNSLRVAHVWMDDMIKYYFMIKPSVKSVDYGDISDRVALRQRLKCRSFRWYLTNIYPEQTTPSNKTNSLAAARNLPPKTMAIGPINLIGTNLCLASAEQIYTKRANIILRKCNNESDQDWNFQTDLSLMLAKMLCLHHLDTSTNHKPRLMKCNYGEKLEHWKFHDIRSWMGSVLHTASRKCLGVPRASEGAVLEVQDCQTFVETQQFRLNPKYKRF
ncbi:polypeptide N-acetylgalactosaminyltransferase 11-like [Tubulanus polymorphus]|uniref:polypeptide N-acetylgalactosaminyltransferase 11-like n=1 Tax=Tubulanus polymorphus TaxID=672921 RepID=UPI003DA217FB